MGDRGAGPLDGARAAPPDVDVGFDDLATAVFAPDPDLDGGEALAPAGPQTGPPTGAAATAGAAAGEAAAAPGHGDPGVGPGRPLTNPGAARVLILNASYEPLHVCSVKRAITLLMQEVAERVLDDDRVLRTPSRTVPVPSVIRLRRYVRRPHRQRVAFNRKNVLRRDDHACQYCGTRAHDLTLDHVLPRSRGGPTSWENVVACCRRCNAHKRDRTPTEARMALRRPPRAPVFMFTSAYGLLTDVDPAWAAYLPRVR